MRAESNADYHADTSRLSNSMLSTLKRSPQEFERRYILNNWPIEPLSKAFRIGHLVHCLLLEPTQFYDRFCCKPEGIDRRTNVGKAAWEALQIHAAGKEIVEQDEYDLAKNCMHSVFNHDQLGSLLRTEESAVIESRVDFEVDGHPMRCKPDWLSLDRGLIVDVKTTADASPSGFAKSVASYGYYRQAALYREAIAQRHGHLCRFLFAVVCTTAPYEVACYELSDTAMQVGIDEALALLNELRKRKASNDWLPVWSKGVVPIDLPKWGVERVYEIESEVEVAA
jgi:hypothetical protein